MRKGEKDERRKGETVQGTKKGWMEGRKEDTLLFLFRLLDGHFNLFVLEGREEGNKERRKDGRKERRKIGREKRREEGRKR